MSDVGAFTCGYCTRDYLADEIRNNLCIYGAEDAEDVKLDVATVGMTRTPKFHSQNHFN